MKKIKKENKKNKTKKKMKLWKKLTIIGASIVMVLSLSLGGFIIYFRAGAKDYYAASEKAFLIPDLNSGVVPQGLEYDSINNYFLVSGYMKNGSASPLYLVHRFTGEQVKRVTFLNKNGSPYTEHFGGVALFGNKFLYVANGLSVLVYDYQQVLDAEDGKAIACKGEISLKHSETDYLKASFVTVYNSKLIVGEFYDGNKYTTLSSHKITTPSGEKNSAIALEFSLNSSYELGIDATPKKAYSLPNKVQGLCFYNNKMYLSTSYGLAFSYILEYDTLSVSAGENQRFLGEAVEVDVYDSSCLTNEYKIAPMSEGIVMVENELYILNESASTKYFFGKLIGGKWCYKTNLTKMKTN